ncbi:hypothetical protein JXL21_13355, partial [Candidatus Bathyarchaeota archaeon]|nr:hypothetical protein [Candidatus Bathyarchaeota archaeon]
RISPNTRRIDAGSNEIKATGVLDRSFGLSSFTTNSHQVIWDRVRVDLTARDARVNIGETVDVDVDAYYEYDGKKIDREDVHLNQDSMRLTNVGDYVFRVVSVDSSYGIDEVYSNELTVAWDMVVFVIDESDQRVIIGSLSRPPVTATYLYDGRPFRGTYTLNQAFGVEVGPGEYYVQGMVDEGHGLTAFTSNHAEYYFDKVAVQSESSHLMPGSYEATFEVSYVSDGSPVTDAEVMVGGERCSHLGMGVYQAQVSSFFPYVEAHAEVAVDGYSVESVTISSLMVGNIGAIVGVLGVGSLTINRYVTGEARKARKLEEIRVRNEKKQRVIHDVNQRSHVVNLDDLTVSGDVEPKLMTTLIKEAMKEGSLRGRLIKKDSRFIHTGAEKEIIRRRLLEDTPSTAKPVEPRVQEKTFGTLWSTVWDDLADYKPVRNWTRDSGYLGRGDFTARRTEEGVECFMEYSGKVLLVPLEDLRYMYDNYRRYTSGNITRSELSSNSRFTKYTISILHMYEDQIL